MSGASCVAYHYQLACGFDQSQRTARVFMTGEKTRERLSAACRGDLGNDEDRNDDRA